MPDAPEKSSGSDASERSRDFRYFASDSIGMALSDNGCKIIFAIEDKPGKSIDQAGVFMAHKTMKLLLTMLTFAIERYEKTTGTVIPPLSDEKIKQLMETASLTSPPDRDSNA